MSWFNASQLSSFAKQALSQAQKSIDRVLDIQEEEPSAWAEAIPYGEPGISPSVSGGWDTSIWGLNSSSEPQSSPTASQAITKPVRRTVVDESENFFSAFLSPSDVQTIQKSPVVSKPPAKSQRPEEEVKSSLQEPSSPGQSRTSETAESEATDSACVSGETPAVGTPSPVPEGKREETASEESEGKVPTVRAKASESVVKVNTAEDVSPTSTQSLTTETKDMALEPKEQKHEDRQSNTPSPPVSSFSSGTSTTSDIEVLDHESVISESSASSRQETSDAKSSLHLMQT